MPRMFFAKSIRAGQITPDHARLIKPLNRIFRKQLFGGPAHGGIGLHAVHPVAMIQQQACQLSRAGAKAGNNGAGIQAQLFLQKAGQRFRIAGAVADVSRRTDLVYLYCCGSRA